jgi:hypothetical protein
MHILSTGNTLQILILEDTPFHVVQKERKNFLFIKPHILQEMSEEWNNSHSL